VSTSLDTINDRLAHALGYTKRTFGEGHPHGGWNRPRQRAIAQETWNPTHNADQAVTALNKATRHSNWTVGHYAPLGVYEATAGDCMQRGGTMAEAMARLALCVFIERGL
jgi:hypothetical protein